MDQSHTLLPGISEPDDLTSAMAEAGLPTLQNMSDLPPAFDDGDLSTPLDDLQPPPLDMVTPFGQDFGQPSTFTENNYASMMFSDISTPGNSTQYTPPSTLQNQQGNQQGNALFGQYDTFRSQPSYQETPTVYNQMRNPVQIPNQHQSAISPVSSMSQIFQSQEQIMNQGQMVNPPNRLYPQSPNVPQNQGLPMQSQGQPVQFVSQQGMMGYYNQPSIPGQMLSHFPSSYAQVTQPQVQPGYNNMPSPVLTNQYGQPLTVNTNNPNTGVMHQKSPLARHSPQEVTNMLPPPPYRPPPNSGHIPMNIQLPPGQLPQMSVMQQPQWPRMPGSTVVYRAIVPRATAQPAQILNIPKTVNKTKKVLAPRAPQLNPRMFAVSMQPPVAIRPEVTSNIAKPNLQFIGQGPVVIRPGDVPMNTPIFFSPAINPSQSISQGIATQQTNVIKQQTQMIPSHSNILSTPSQPITSNLTVDTTSLQSDTNLLQQVAEAVGLSPIDGRDSPRLQSDRAQFKQADSIRKVDDTYQQNKSNAFSVIPVNPSLQMSSPSRQLAQTVSSNININQAQQMPIYHSPVLTTHSLRPASPLISTISQMRPPTTQLQFFPLANTIAEPLYGFPQVAIPIQSPYRFQSSTSNVQFSRLNSTASANSKPDKSHVDILSQASKIKPSIIHNKDFVSPKDYRLSDTLLTLDTTTSKSPLISPFKLYNKASTTDVTCSVSSKVDYKRENDVRVTESLSIHGESKLSPSKTMDHLDESHRINVGVVKTDEINDIQNATKSNAEENTIIEEIVKTNKDDVNEADDTLELLNSETDDSMSTENNLNSSIGSRQSELHSSMASVDSRKAFDTVNQNYQDEIKELVPVDDLESRLSQDQDEVKEGSISTIKNKDDIPIEYDDEEFVWEVYLENHGALAALHTSFRHVECSLQSGFKKGMKLEIVNKDGFAYWIATIMMNCGPLLRLRYDGYKDRSKDFWCDVQSTEVRQLGWCHDNNKDIKPPDGLILGVDGEDLDIESIKNPVDAETPAQYLLDKCTGYTPAEQIRQGMRLEIHHELDPRSFWVVKVMENVGGRLLLRYEGSDSAAHDFWMFYLHHRLHPLGYTHRIQGIYRPPEVIKGEHSDYTEWAEILQTSLREANEMTMPADILIDQQEIPEHSFLKGYKLEALDPVTKNHFYPATVVQVVNSKYFIVEIDNLLTDVKKAQICCHGSSPNIFPMRWTFYQGLKLSPPKGWKNRDGRSDFDWQEYLSDQRAEAAPEKWFKLRVDSSHGFERGMKLEAVDPVHPNHICAATITKIVDRLMWIHLDSGVKVMANHIVSIDSFDVFPIGWCESNGYQLKPPRRIITKRKTHSHNEKPDSHISPDEYRSKTFSQTLMGDEGDAWCPKIYFNHKCFSGPLLSKGRIAELPKCVGPGPVTLVMKEVLSMLINVAYKSSRVLREIQLDGEPNMRMHQQVLKAKYKGKSYQAVVEISRYTNQIEEFCRQICIKLECCPNLFSPFYISDRCPENCSQLTKTKYTNFYGKKKKRKIGRPPGGHSNLEERPVGRPKKKKRKKVNFIKESPDYKAEEKEDISGGDNNGEIQQINESYNIAKDKCNNNYSKSFTDADEFMDQYEDYLDDEELQLKRKYVHHHMPPTEIVTRGSKMPKYSFERKTHKKVLIGDEQMYGDDILFSDLPKIPKKRGRPPKRLKPGRPPKTKNEETFDPIRLVRSPLTLQLSSNPLQWTVGEVVEFIKTTDCANVARLFKEQAIDGQALLMLNLPTIQEHLELKLGPAVKLCHQVEKLKMAFFEQFD